MAGIANRFLFVDVVHLVEAQSLGRDLDDREVLINAYLGVVVAGTLVSRSVDSRRFPRLIRWSPQFHW